MDLMILPEIYAIEESKKVDVSTAIISITCPNEGAVIFYSNPNIKKILRLEFNDLEHDVDGIKAPVIEDFDNLKSFVDRLDDIDLLIVHCGAGYSRSAGLACAINEYLSLGYNIFDDRRFGPNKLVYKLACQQLGIGKNKDYYKNIDWGNDFER